MPTDKSTDIKMRQSDGIKIPIINESDLCEVLLGNLPNRGHYNSAIVTLPVHGEFVPTSGDIHERSCLPDKECQVHSF